MSALTVVLLLSLLLGLQPVTTDLYLPALPSITQGFGDGMPQAQLTLTALLLAFAVWMVWSVVVAKLPLIGFDYTTDQLFWLAALPGLSGHQVLQRLSASAATACGLCATSSTSVGCPGTI